MGLIRQIITPQIDEIIRDRIGAILKDEIDCQYLQYNSDAMIQDVWIERVKPFDPVELPAINVSVPKGEYDNEHQGSVDGTYTFFIDVHTQSSATENDGGDKLANFQMKRLLGICRYILADPQYKTLGFAPGQFIERVRVGNFEVKPHYKDFGGLWSAALNSSMGRLTVTVRANQTNILIEPKLLQIHVTSLRLFLTDKGYKYSYVLDSLIPPPPYAVFSEDGINVLTNITGLDYDYGSLNPPESSLFGLYAAGLIPPNDDITITPDSNFTTNFEVYNPNTSSYTSSGFIISYTGGSKILNGFKVRLKSGLLPNDYSGSLTIIAPNTSPFVLTISSTVSIVYDADALIFFGFLSPKPSPDQKIRYNNVFLALKSKNIWNNSDRYWLLAAEESQHATISLKNPSSIPLTLVNNPMFTQYEGFRGNGIDSYIDTNYIMNNSSVYLQDDASYGFYLRDDIASDTMCDMCVTDTSPSNNGNIVNAKTSVGAFLATINYNGVGANIDIVLSSAGYSSVVRFASDSASKYKNGVFNGDISNISTGRAINSVPLLAMKYLGTIINLSSRQMSMAYFGNKNVDQADNYSIVQDYMTSLGTQV